MADKNIEMPNSEIIIYQTDDGETKIDVKMEDETVWLTQAQIVELYQASHLWVCKASRAIFPYLQIQR